MEYSWLGCIVLTWTFQVTKTDMATLTLSRYILETSLMFFDLNRMSESLLASAAFMLASSMKNSESVAEWWAGKLSIPNNTLLRSHVDENNWNSRKSWFTLSRILSAFLTFSFVIDAFHDSTKRQVDGCLTCRSPVLHKYTGYTRKDVEPVMWMVNHMMHISRQQKFRKNSTVYSKYSHE